MLIDSEKVRETKQKIEVMEAFINGKEIELKKLFTDDNYKTADAPIWDFTTYKYRIKPSEPEYVYPIYKRLKATPETVVKFTSIDTGIYISTETESMYYRPGDAAKNMLPHTSCSWEDYEFIEKKEEEEATIISKQTTIELFEVMVYCDIIEEYSIKKSLYSNENLEELQHYQKTGRSFIIDKDTRQIIRVINT